MQMGFDPAVRESRWQFWNAKGRSKGWAVHRQRRTGEQGQAEDWPVHEEDGGERRVAGFGYRKLCRFAEWLGNLPGLVRCGLVLVLVGMFAGPGAVAQENPYIVAYDHNLEEPGSLEVEYFSTFGTQRGGPDFHGFWSEFEYGATAWWTTEFYLDAQSTFGESTIFTGFRWENRFRPLKDEHFGVVRKKMPVWSKLPEPERWQLVSYILSLNR